MTAGKSWFGVVRILLILALVTYATVLGGFYFFQRSLEYKPITQSPGLPSAVGLPQMKVVSVKTEDGLDLLAWFVAPKKKDGKVVVIFHGSCCTLANRAAKAKYFINHGYGVFLSEYRGYGGNPGSPSEEGLYIDGRAALQWLGKQGYQRDQFVLYGNSLGSGVATQMAIEIKAKILILEAPYTTTADVGQILYPWLPVHALMIDKFDSLSKIGKIHPALLIVHGDKDNYIPYVLGEKLFEAANEPKTFMTIEGGMHSNLYKVGAGNKIVAWLDQQVKKEKR